MRMRTKEPRLINVNINMSLYNYFHAAVQNDNPFGLSSKSVPAKTLVEVSKQVKAAQEKRRKRGPYTRNSEEDKLLIGRHASENGIDWKTCQ